MVSTKTLSLFLDAFTLLNITRTQYGSKIADITYGDHPAGTIMYTNSFYMSAVLTTTDPALRPESLTLPAQANQSEAEWAEIGWHSLAYSGPFHFNEDFGFAGDGREGQVLHGPLTSATLPAFVGSIQRRNFTFTEDGEYLNLRGDLGNGIVDNLWWKRVERHLTIV